MSNYKFWTRKEEAEVIRLAELGIDDKTISYKVGHSLAAVTNKRRRLLNAVKQNQNVSQI